MNVIVFDIGGTLMEYVNMPNVWIDYYDSAFRHVREKLGLPLTDEQLEARRTAGNDPCAEAV